MNYYTTKQNEKWGKNNMSFFDSNNLALDQRHPGKSVLEQNTAIDAQLESVSKLINRLANTLNEGMNPSNMRDYMYAAETSAALSKLQETIAEVCTVQTRDENPFTDQPTPFCAR